MRAVRFHSYGPPEVLQVDEVPTPAPRDGEALVRIEACGANWRDVDQRRGTYGTEFDLPYCPGCDVVGIVEAAAGDAGQELVGRRVLVHPTLSCGTCRACRAGQDHRCSTVRLALSGGYAEFIAAPVRNLVPVSSTTDPVTLAALPTTYLTAWHALMTRARLAAGDTVLILGATGGVATAAIEIAKFAGARCLLATRHPERASHPLYRGLEMLRNDRDLVGSVLGATDGEGVDIVLDPLGGELISSLTAAVRPGGTFVTYGWLLAVEATVDLRVLARREISVVGTRLGSRSEFDRLLSIVLRNSISPIIHQALPLSEAATAHLILERGEHVGKVVLTP